MKLAAVVFRLLPEVKWYGLNNFNVMCCVLLWGLVRFEQARQCGKWHQAPGGFTKKKITLKQC
jgi:hypothetical protein